MPEEDRPQDGQDSPAPTRPPERLVGGKYRLGRLLGEGGMGAVYEAEHIGLGVTVAVKLLNEIFASDPNSVSRFRREARAAAAIRHPNIVTVTDTGTDEGSVPFIVMELLEGESLSSLLRRERQLAPEVAAAIACQILSGLQAAHEKGVIHRDLKPGNVLIAIRPDGGHQVKVLDFGISKFFTGGHVPDVTAIGAVIGTPRFMAPEQARGQLNLDARVDLYAVGVLLYRMLTGRLPYNAATQDDLLAQILDAAPTPPRELRPDISPAQEAVVLKAMASSRDDRYACAADFHAALLDATPGLSAEATLRLPSHLILSASTTGPIPAPTPSIVGAGLLPAMDFPTPSAENFVTGETRAWQSEVRPPAGEGEVGEVGAAPPARRSGRRWLLPLALLPLVGVPLWYWKTHTASTKLPASAATAPPLTFGITRYLPPQILVRTHEPLMRYLSKELGRPVKLRILDDYVDLAGQLLSGELDVAGLSGYAYVRAKRRSPSIRVLATYVTAGESSYEGAILVRTGSALRSLKDLNGKVFCYVNPTSASGYLYPRSLFRRAGLDPDRAFSATRFTGDHLGALRALQSGACDGAAVFAGVFLESSRHGMWKHQFRFLAVTDRIPNDAYCTSERLPPKVAAALQAALLKLKSESPRAKEVLGATSRVTGFAEARDSDYDSVRRIERFLDDASPSTRKKE
ncbi:MAG: phosphate/phosphite/phosphonate ABC transporter substrate-binding protein [Deltaproteobacteria bacterium]|nr:phosphate/phosphite/phosphonate ABC transporter substrate-binding protein [Deltaproteobacteria bacterium]